MYVCMLVWTISLGRSNEHRRADRLVALTPQAGNFQKFDAMIPGLDSLTS